MTILIWVNIDVCVKSGKIVEYQSRLKCRQNFEIKNRLKLDFKNLVYKWYENSYISCIKALRRVLGRPKTVEY